METLVGTFVFNRKTDVSSRARAFHPVGPSTDKTPESSDSFRVMSTSHFPETIILNWIYPMVHGETADVRAGIETTESKLAVRHDIICRMIETQQWPRTSSLVNME